MLYAKERLGIELWSKQAEIARALVKNRVVVAYTANGIGKSTLSAVLDIWWLDVHREPDTVAFLTGSSWHAVENVLCPQINRYVKANNVFPDAKIGLTAIQLPTGGRQVSRSTNDPEGTAGLHGEFLLTLVDEASGMEQKIVDALFGNATGSENRTFISGNPLAPVGSFYDLTKSNEYVVISISAFEHPNVISGVEQIKGAVTRQSIEDKADRWCTKCSPHSQGAVHLWWLEERGWYIPDSRFISRVMGQFPTSGSETLIPPMWIENASKKIPQSNKPTAIGCDVARSEHGDETVITLANEFGILEQICRVGQTLPETVGIITNLVREHVITKPVAVDADGMGVGVIDGLRENNIDVLPVHYGGSPLDRDRFFNLKAELYWSFREAIENGYTIPNDERLHRQAKQVHKGFTPKGQIKIESKDDYKKRTGESPDRFESCTYALYAVGGSSTSFGAELYADPTYDEDPQGRRGRLSDEMFNRY